MTDPFAVTPISADRPHTPKPLLDGMQTTVPLEMLLDPAYHAIAREPKFWEPDQKRIGGYFLPPFQRPAVWDAERQARYVESAWLGITLGSLVVVDGSDVPMQDGRYTRTDRWLIDGQQRLTALLAYRHEGLRVFAGTSCEHVYSDLTERETRQLDNITIGLTRIRSGDERRLAAIYNRLNFGGIAHTEDQRAPVA